MKTILKALGQRVREIAYLLISFPVSVLLFCFVILGFTSGIALPFAVLIFLFLLTIMEKISSFEIKRANKMLKTDFIVTDNWFSHPFFSWDGVRERITSLRSWMAIGYVFVSFGWSLFSFVLVTLGLSGIFLIITVLGITLLSNFTQSFQIIDGGDKFSGNISFIEATKSIRLEFGDVTSSAESIGIWNRIGIWVLAFFLFLSPFGLFHVIPELWREWLKDFSPDPSCLKFRIKSQDL